MSISKICCGRITLQISVMAVSGFQIFACVYCYEEIMRRGNNATLNILSVTTFCFAVLLLVAAIQVKI